MHAFDDFSGVAGGCEIRLDGLVHDRDERDDVRQWDEGRGLDSVGLVLFEGGVAQGDLLLVIEPILIVGAQAGVLDPLLEAEIAFGEVFGVGIPSGSA